MLTQSKQTLKRMSQGLFALEYNRKGLYFSDLLQNATALKTKLLIRIAATAGFITAITTFLLWLLPRLYEAPASFAEAVLLYQNPYYMARQWVNFIHIPLALLAYFGLTLVLRRQERGKAGFGILCFAGWGFIEMVGVAIILFSVNADWRPKYTAASAAQRVIYQNNIETFYSIWDSLFFVLLIAFLLGSLFFGWATWQSKGLQKVLSYFFWLAVPLTILIILSNYADQAWAGQITNSVYPLLQPASRFVLGLFLRKSAANITDNSATD